jgi:uncharacterized protein (TIGR02284 family)
VGQLDPKRVSVAEIAGFSPHRETLARSATPTQRPGVKPLHLFGEPTTAGRLYGCMTTNDNKTLLVLNSLIRAGRDAEQGYLAAADGVTEPELVQLFAGYALQRAKFVGELQERVRLLRGTPENNGSLAGEVHRTWMEFKAAIEANDTHAVLSECERGEDMAVMACREALAERDIDNQTRGIIQRHYEFVQAAHDRVRQLRDSTAYAQR